MKLPIKKKYFDAIKNGEKELEFRDAHITFVCEETGKTLRKEIWRVDLLSRERLRHKIRNEIVHKEFDELFEDDVIVMFDLK